jgi:hypothetical protein
MMLIFLLILRPVSPCQVGALILDLALFGALGVAIYSTFHAAGGVKALTEFAQDIISLKLWQ